MGCTSSLTIEVRRKCGGDCNWAHLSRLAVRESCIDRLTSRRTWARDVLVAVQHRALTMLLSALLPPCLLATLFATGSARSTRRGSVDLPFHEVRRRTAAVRELMMPSWSCSAIV